MCPLLAGCITIAKVRHALAMAIGLVRVMRGPSARDRLLAADGVHIVGMFTMTVLLIRHDGEQYFEGARRVVPFAGVGVGALVGFRLRWDRLE